MITPLEYLDKLKEIELLDYEEREINPEEEPIFNVYLNTRKISVPSEFRRLAMEGDHLSETIWFAMDRYFDGVDLSTKVIAIAYETPMRASMLKANYISKHGDDLKTLMIGWSIPYDVTELAGSVSIGLVIYSLTEDKQSIDYCLNVEPFQSTIGKAMHITSESDKIYPPADTLSSILDRLNELYENEEVKRFKYEDLYNLPTLNSEEFINSVNIKALSTPTKDGKNLFFDVDYTKLINIPKINGVAILGDVSGDDLNISIDIDPSLNANSSNPVENKVVTSNINLINKEIEKIKEEMEGMSYVPLSISNFVNNINLAEKGSTVNDITFNWTINGNPISIMIDDFQVEDISATEAILSDLALKENHIFELKAEDRKGNAVSADSEVAFVYKVYYGAISAPESYNQDFIKNLEKYQLQPSKEAVIEVNAQPEQYIYYCLPSSYGECVFTSGGFSGGFLKIDTISVENDYGITTDYDIWKSDNAGLGQTVITIS